MAYQSFVKNPKFLIESFIDATKNAYCYLMMDFTQKTPFWRRLRSKIFPIELDGEAPILYLPNDEDFEKLLLVRIYEKSALYNISCL